MSLRTRTSKSSEAQLEELSEKLKVEQQNEPLGFNSKIADLSFQILRLKKTMKIAVPGEQDQLIGLMMEHAYYMKTGQRDRYVAEKAFNKVLRIDPGNPEANYRYAFLHYEVGGWITAINYFKHAIQNNDSEFPLSEDQLIKANLFIGYCSVMLAKESMKIAEALSIESDALFSEGISIEKLSKKLKGLLDKTEYTLITNNGQQLISKEAYQDLVNEDLNIGLLLDIAASVPILKYGDQEVNINLESANLLKKLLLKGAKDEALSLVEITGYQEEVISATHGDISWDTYRQRVSRMNQKLVEIGIPERFIKHVPQTRSYKITNIDYFIIQKDGE